MIKYRLLNIEELESLQKEFVDFLVVNGITADDWHGMKQADNPRANDLLEIFSNLVFDTIFNGKTYLLKTESSVIYAFQFSQTKADLFVMTIIDTIDDFFNFDWNVSDLWANWHNKVRIQWVEKNYILDRNQEMYSLWEKGAIFAKGHEFKKLSEWHLLLCNSNN